MTVLCHTGTLHVTLSPGGRARATPSVRMAKRSKASALRHSKVQHRHPNQRVKPKSRLPSIPEDPWPLACCGLDHVIEQLWARVGTHQRCSDHLSAPGNAVFLSGLGFGGWVWYSPLDKGRCVRAVPAPYTNTPDDRRSSTCDITLIRHQNNKTERGWGVHCRFAFLRGRASPAPRQSPSMTLCVLHAQTSLFLETPSHPPCHRSHKAQVQTACGRSGPAHGAWHCTGPAALENNVHKSGGLLNKRGVHSVYSSPHRVADWSAGCATELLIHADPAGVAAKQKEVNGE